MDNRLDNSWHLHFNPILPGENSKSTDQKEINSKAKAVAERILITDSDTLSNEVIEPLNKEVFHKIEGDSTQEDLKIKKNFESSVFGFVSDENLELLDQEATDFEEFESLDEGFSLRDSEVALEKLTSLADACEKKIENKFLELVGVIGSLEVYDFISLADLSKIQEMKAKIAEDHTERQNHEKIDLRAYKSELKSLANQFCFLGDDGSVQVKDSNQASNESPRMAVLRNQLPKVYQHNFSKVNPNLILSKIQIRSVKSMSAQTQNSMLNLITTYFKLNTQIFILKNLIEIALTKSKKNSEKKNDVVLKNQEKEVTRPESTVVENKFDQKPPENNKTKSKANQLPDLQFLSQKKKERINGENRNDERTRLKNETIKKKDQIYWQKQEEIHNESVKFSGNEYAVKIFTRNELEKTLELILANDKRSNLDLNQLKKSISNCDIEKLLETGSTVIVILEHVYNTLSRKPSSNEPSYLLEKLELEKLGHFLQVLGSKPA